MSIVNYIKHNFITREYIKISLQGNWCICTPLEALSEILASDYLYKDSDISSVWMTPKEFEDMTEFGGF